MADFRDSIQQEIQDQVRTQVAAHTAILELRLMALEKQVMSGGAASLNRHKSSHTSCDFAPATPTSTSDNASYTPLSISGFARDLLPATSNVSGEGIAHQLPESMYNYCMQRLAASPDPLYDPALRWWLLLFAVQFFILAGFVVYNDLDISNIGVAPPAMRDRAIANCMFSSTAIAGTPLLQYCIGYAAIVLVASVIRSDDEGNFVATFSQTKSVVTYITNFAWLWQNVFVPGCFSLEAAAMFASSSDGMTIVTNTLAVTFIMEIDNMLYSNLLTEEAKGAYQQRTGLPPQEVSPGPARASWALMALNIILMPMMYTILMLQLGSGEYGQAYLTQYWYRNSVFYAIEFAVRALVQRSMIEGHDVWASLPVAGAQAVLATILYLVAVAFACGKILLLWPFPGPFFQWGYHASEFAACIDWL